MDNYENLDAIAVRDTVDRLQARISARFPTRNLQSVAGELSEAITELTINPRSPWYRTMQFLSRILVILVGVVALSGIVFLVVGAVAAAGPEPWEWASFVETIINDVVFAGVAVFFLWQIPKRVQRAHDLESLHRLRSLAHVIDMHQLTKDPDRLSTGYVKTSESIDLDMDMHELWGYLDYCSEMLSLVGKAGALFAEQNNDDVVLATVEGIEDLTTGMSRKIWQKIALLKDGQA